MHSQIDLLAKPLCHRLLCCFGSRHALANAACCCRLGCCTSLLLLLLLLLLLIVLVLNNLNRQTIARNCEAGGRIP